MLTYSTWVEVIPTYSACVEVKLTIISTSSSPHQALESLSKKDITEIKSYGRPPALVEKVMEAVMILRGNDPTWPEAKRQLGENPHYS